MKNSIFNFLFILLGASVYAQSNPPKTVPFVDLEKYSGLWYELAKIPNKFQAQCIRGTTAQYTLNDEGELRVLNSCIDEDNEIDQAEGVARIIDKTSNAKLEVSFVSFLGWRPFWGDYWVIGLDENYKWAVVGTPDRKYGWILSRTKKLSPETMEMIFKIIKEQGYNPEDFKMSEQS
jgi:apolipoprotein D and lipocalin family protein